MAKSTHTMVRHALSMMLGTFASRVLGLVREIITAAWFGASGVLDAFNVSFKSNTAYLPGVISRKKQIVPALSLLWG